MPKPAFRKHAIYVIDPTNGEKTSLSALAKRHGLSTSLVNKRYHDGKQGAALIERYDRRLEAEQQRQQLSAREARIDRAFWVNTRGLACPLKRLGDVVSRGESFQ
ncbi:MULTISPECIES: hypothetical protein [unclassified Halomonas]|uniref:hypothetical protein n=1 Tax=unclassified Halomonas TaxID=2609666 RepID=UPI00207676A9|nr:MULTISPECIES: hypothetical protein [unclassified Halomonas]